MTKRQFYFETPLYEEINEHNLQENVFEGEVDAYSPTNHIETTYAITADPVNKSFSDAYKDFLRIRLRCKRRSDDALYFFVFKLDESLIKIGQWPSLADMQFAEIGKTYDKHLSRDDLKDFKRAIGLAAHGVGAGSFVYLRRIFEKLIQNAYDENASSLTDLKQDFGTLRMEQKVEALRPFLPEQLIAMRKIYSILSSGVHELSEEECLSYFPALKLSIELILKQQIEKEQKLARDKAAAEQIRQIERMIQKKEQSG